MTKMTAPPSTAYKIVDVPEAYAEVIKRHRLPGTFVGPSDEESPWVPFGPNAAIRHLLFDTRHNIFSNILCIESAGLVATHKHRGTVVMVCPQGSARTWVSDHTGGVNLFAWLQGPIEFHDDQGTFVETLDVWWFIDHDENYCREHGIPNNKQLYI